MGAYLNWVEYNRNIELIDDKRCKELEKEIKQLKEEAAHMKKEREELERKLENMKRNYQLPDAHVNIVKPPFIVAR